MKKDVANKLLDKVRDDYDAIAADFSATRTDLWPELARFGELLRSGDRVLDVGCGNGRAYQLLTGKAIEYVGIDVSPKLIEEAQRLNREMPSSFRVGSMLDLPYGDGSFNVVLAIAVLNHVPSKEYRLKALAETHRVLKPGGLLLMTNWNLWNLRHLKKNFRGLASGMLQAVIGRRDFGDVLVPWRRGPNKASRYYHAFRMGELRALISAAGFNVKEAYFAAKGSKVPWWSGDNLVMIAEKPKA